MLGEWVNADNNLRTPALEKIGHITHCSLVEKLARVWTEAIDCPVEIFHPVLPISQHPVVETDKFRRDVVSFFNRAHNANSVGFAFDKALNASHNRCRGRAMASASVRRNDQNFRSVRIHQYWRPLSSNRDAD